MQAIMPQEINAYLPKDKWQVDTSGAFSETELEKNATSRTLGALSGVYPVDDWRAGEAPKLVRQVIAMHMAAWIYARQFSEDTADVNSHASWLLRQAESVLSGILTGAITLEETPWSAESVGSAVSGDPIFTTGRVF